MKPESSLLKSVGGFAVFDIKVADATLASYFGQTLRILFGLSNDLLVCR